jgi:hypothetical protein
MLVEIPFSPAMAAAALAGRKCCTTRTGRKAGPGDEFAIDEFRFRVLDVALLPLHRAVSEFYRLEGFASPADCADAIRGFYPRLEPVSPVWVHYFARLP